ncbi:grasp-with-spasm system ATP-grasp peptide maturase [Lewinella cohaerens]|uniref:grasp-with-spasm system ATP-grasp peptide maturase n=1 Tax=Lewinella cohaerens TaxID=70995 RepID=UPI0003A13479|nr:grasp-with-spasm system ATP-grasp peptide maturase [Lewinella cohaerens]
MITIFSSNSDNSTNNVIDWLYLNCHPYTRINGDINKSWNSFTMSINSSKEEDSSLNIGQVWFRRLPQSLPKISFSEARGQVNLGDQDRFNRYFHKEIESARSGIISMIRNNCFCIGNPKVHNINKLETLILATKCGFTIPSTLVTEKKKEVLRFLMKKKRIVTKPSYEGIGFNIDNIPHMGYTEEITREHIDDFPEEFALSCFQELIEKEIEIRTFYLDGECYSMAIFSQLDSQTNIDFRRYNTKRRNRNIPFQLPRDVEEKIKTLMQEIDLNCGSIDLIYSKNKKFIFLEINPVGQYGMTSHPCNYNLDKVIADKLAKGI